MESSPNDGKEEKIGGKESDGVENERGNPHMKKKGFPQGFIFPHTITSFGPILSFSSDVFLLAPRLLQISFSFWRNRNAIFRASVPKGKLHLKERPKGRRIKTLKEKMDVEKKKKMCRKERISPVNIFAFPFFGTSFSFSWTSHLFLEFCRRRWYVLS